MSGKANVLLVGSGGVGTMGAYALEAGGKATVTAVLRSNYDAVEKSGFSFDSIDHGKATGWKPSQIRKTIPNVMEEKLQPFDFIVVTTKNIPDVKPTVTDIIAPAVTPDTAIVLVQNGLNIENPILQAFPGNPVVSGVSLIGATETSHGVIRHDDSDSLIVGPFTAASESAAKRFVEIYGASGKVDCSYEPNVQFSRWNKLMYNASFNSVATILRMDTSRMRASQHVIHDLILPAMYEIRAIAKSKGIELPPNREQVLISIDPYEAFFKPSMCQDILKGNYIEFENIVGEPLREAQKAGVPAPTLKTLYGLLKGLQYATKEAKGVVVVPQTVEELQAQGGK